MGLTPLVAQPRKPGSQPTNCNHYRVLPSYSWGQDPQALVPSPSLLYHLTPTPLSKPGREAREEGGAWAGSARRPLPCPGGIDASSQLVLTEPSPECKAGRWGSR